jgi:hypothetical protein
MRLVLVPKAVEAGDEGVEANGVGRASNEPFSQLPLMKMNEAAVTKE